MTSPKLTRTGISLMAALLLSACTFSTPTHVQTASKIELMQDSFTMQEDTAAITPQIIEGISRHYWAQGDGPMHVSVVYDPHSRINTAMKARDESNRISKLLGGQGVRDIQADTMPVQQSGDISQTMISYATLVAEVDPTCGAPLSMAFADFELGNDYKLGCSVDNYVAKQVARPRDLLGNDTMDNSDGRRNSNIVEGYRTGSRNEPLEGESASEN